MSEMYFTADTHFGHRRILEHRGFESADEMDEALIKAWNHVVKPGDRVYHLGDLSFRKPGETMGILGRLNGQLHLIQGNHDRLKLDMRHYFASISDIKEVKLGTRTIVCCHFPFETWNKSHYGSWHLHGHSHGNLRTHRPCRMDVGVDTRESWAPYHEDEIYDLLKNHKYKPVDHHE